MSDAASIVSSLFSMGMILGLALAGLLFIIFYGHSRKTKEYRKDITNLYVAGRIRQIADKDGINISDEYEVYKQFIKKRKMEDWDLDVTIEEELKDKIMEEDKVKKGK